MTLQQTVRTLSATDAKQQTYGTTLRGIADGGLTARAPSHRLGICHGDEPTMTTSRHARLFRNGRNQAVRIPREFELAVDEVVIYREDHRLVIEPVERPPSLAEVLSELTPLDEDLPDIDDPPTNPENPL